MYTKKKTITLCQSKNMTQITREIDKLGRLQTSCKEMVNCSCYHDTNSEMENKISIYNMNCELQVT